MSARPIDQLSILKSSRTDTSGLTPTARRGAVDDFDEPVILRFPMPDLVPAAHTSETPVVHTTTSPVVHTSVARVYTLEKPPKPKLPKTVKPKKKRKHKSAPLQRDLLGGVVGKSQNDALSFAEKYADGKPSPERAEELALTVTLPCFWRDFMKSTKENETADNTVTNYQTAVNLYQAHAPRDDKPSWMGMPIGCVSKLYLEAFFNAALPGRSPHYIRSTWIKLRVILNHAKELGLISAVPRPKLPKAPPKKVVIYQNDQVEQVYRSLADFPDLQVAFVLALNAGMRPVDLFLLDRSNLMLGDQPRIEFVSRKTKLPQVIPLAPITVRHLLRLPDQGQRLSPLFPGRSDPTSDDPERSRYARDRTELVKACQLLNGIEFDKPFQAARATCNTRLLRFGPSVCNYVLGHRLKGVNEQHYSEPTELVFEAINTVAQPACFNDF
jgi:integrase